MKKGYKYNYGGMPQKPTGTRQPVSLDAIIKKNMQKFVGGGEPTPWADVVANSWRPPIQLSPTQQKVMKTISNLPIYTPDARYGEYQDILPYWQDNVAFTPVIEDYSNFGPGNTPSVGSYFTMGTPSPLANAWRSGNTYINPKLFTKYDNRGNVVEHETLHAGFNGRDVPQWMIDNLNKINRNPGSGEHANLLNEQLVNQAIARQSVLDEFGLPANATIPEELSNEYLRRGIYSKMRNPDAPDFKHSVQEAISGNKPGAFNKLINYRKYGGPGDGLSPEQLASLNRAKMRVKMALAAEWGNPSAKRMVSHFPPSYRFTGNEMINGENVVGFGENQVRLPATGTHFMSSMGEFAVPYIQQDNSGKMIFNPNASFRDREAIRFDNPEDAQYFAEHYKDVAPMMQNFKKNGGFIKYKNGGDCPCPDQPDCKCPLKEDYSAMSGFYNDMYEAANKYANPNTGMVSPFNSTRATLKAIIKHPDVLFMKRYPLDNPESNPYGVSEFTVPKVSGGTKTYIPSEWANPINQREPRVNTDRQNRREIRKFDRQIKRGIRNQGKCWSGDCYDNELNESAYGGDISLPNVYPNQMISKFAGGGEPCPNGQVKVNGQCMSIAEAEALRQRAYNSGLDFQEDENGDYYTIGNLKPVVVQSRPKHTYKDRNINLGNGVSFDYLADETGRPASNVWDFTLPAKGQLAAQRQKWKKYLPDIYNKSLSKPAAFVTNPITGLTYPATEQAQFKSADPEPQFLTPEQKERLKYFEAYYGKPKNQMSDWDLALKRYDEHTDYMDRTGQFNPIRQEIFNNTIGDPNNPANQVRDVISDYILPAGVVASIPVLIGGAGAAGSALASTPLGSATLTALETPMAGVPGLTGTNLINAYFGYKGATRVPEVYKNWRAFAKNPSQDNFINSTANTLQTGLELLPFTYEAIKGIPSVINDVKKGFDFISNNALKAKDIYKNIGQTIKENPMSVVAPEPLRWQQIPIYDLEELRRIWHNHERIMTAEELSFLNNNGFGAPDAYRVQPSWQQIPITTQPSPSRFNLSRSGQTGLRTPNIGPRPTNIPSSFASDSEMENWYTTTFPRMTDRELTNELNAALQQQHNTTLDELRNLVASGTMTEQEAYDQMHNALRTHTNNFELWDTRPPLPTTRPFPSSNTSNVLTNRSGTTLEDAIKNSKGDKKDALSKMTPDQFRETVTKPDGEVVTYKPALELSNEGKMKWNPNERKMQVEGTQPMTSKEYVDEFNSRLDVLNDIIEANNTSGTEYRVTGLDENGTLHFDGPTGDVTWNLEINPGQWRGNVEDIANTDYFGSIPGLSMRNTTGSVFGDRTARRGSKAYESINEYLKRFDLGRVKAGFNSQSRSSFPLWKDAILKGKAFGFLKDGQTVHGIFKKQGGATQQFEYGGPLVDFYKGRMTGPNMFDEGGQSIDCPCPEFNCDCPPGYGTASKSDSIRVMQGALNQERFFKNPGSYTGAIYRTIPNSETGASDKNLLKQLEEKRNKPYLKNKKKYYKNIDKNKFEQRELTTQVVNEDIPIGIYDRRIQPTKIITKEGSGIITDALTGEKGLKGDVVEIPHYDPIAVTPWDMLTPEQQQIRLKEYGTQGTPYNGSTTSTIQEQPQQKTKFAFTYSPDGVTQKTIYYPTYEAWKEAVDKANTGKPGYNAGMVQTTVAGNNSSAEALLRGTPQFGIGGQSNKYFYNKGYGAPQFKPGGTLNCPCPDQPDCKCPDLVQKGIDALRSFYKSRPANINDPNTDEYINDLRFRERTPWFMKWHFMPGRTMGYYNPITDNVGYVNNNQQKGYGDLSDTVRHEIGHKIFEELNPEMKKIIKNSILPRKEVMANMESIVKPGRKARKYIKYISRPTEFYTRRNKVYQTFGLDPSQPITREQAQRLVDFTNAVNTIYTPGAEKNLKEGQKLSDIFKEKYPDKVDMIDQLVNDPDQMETIEFMSTIKNDPETYMQMFNDVTKNNGMIGQDDMTMSKWGGPLLKNFYQQRVKYGGGILPKPKRF